MKRFVCLLLAAVLLTSVPISAVCVQDALLDPYTHTATVFASDIDGKDLVLFAAYDGAGKQLTAEMLESAAFQTTVGGYAATVDLSRFSDAKSVKAVSVDRETFEPTNFERKTVNVADAAAFIGAALEAERNPQEHFILRVTEDLSLTGKFYQSKVDASSSNPSIDSFGMTSAEQEKFFIATTDHFLYRPYVPDNAEILVDHQSRLSLRAFSDHPFRASGEGSISFTINASNAMNYVHKLSTGIRMASSAGLTYNITSDFTSGNLFVPSKAQLQLSEDRKFTPKNLVLGYETPYDLVRPGIDTATAVRDERVNTSADATSAGDQRITDVTTLAEARAAVDKNAAVLRTTSLTAKEFDTLTAYMTEKSSNGILLAKNVRFEKEWTVFSVKEAPLQPKNEPSPEIAEKQRAIVQNAYAYYYHDPYVQYDSTSLVTGVGRSSSRLNTRFTPEQAAAPDEPIFSVCSDFTYRIVWESLGYRLLSHSDARANEHSYDFVTQHATELPADHPLVVLKYGGADGMRNFNEARYLIHERFQPGDLFVYYLNGTAGHAECYVGDPFGMGEEYMVDCGDKRMDTSTGEDPFDVGGAINQKDVHSEITSLSASWKNKIDRFVILRPAAMPEAKVTPSGISRLNHPFLDIKKTFSQSSYCDVANGENLTVKITVANRGSTDYTDLEIVDPIPAGQAVKGADILGGGTEEDGRITWRVDVPAGEERTVGYTVPVNGNVGDRVTFEAGTVDGTIVTRAATFAVGGKRLTESEVKTLQDRKNEFASEAFANDYRSAFAYVAAIYNEIHKGAGTKMRFSGLSESDFFSKLTQRTTYNDGKKNYILLTQKAPTDKQTEIYSSMILPEHFGGKLVLPSGTGTSEMDISERVLAYWEENYRPGDVFFYYSGKISSLTEPFGEKSTTAQIYLGNNEVLSFRYGKAEILSFEKSIQSNLIHNIVVAVRPSLGGLLD